MTPDEAHALTAAVKDEGRTDRTIGLVRRPEVRGLIDYGRQGAALFFWAVMGRQAGEYLHSRFPLLSEQNAAIAGTVVGTLIGNYQENIIDRTVRFFSGEPERFRWMPVIALSDDFGASAPA